MVNNEKRGGDLFIVDNSISGWTGLEYLRQWTGIANAFDVATGFFEIGSLLALDGDWQKLDKIRILLGAESTERTRKLLLESLKAKASSTLDQSLESQKKDNPFLNGVEAIRNAMASGQIECRLYKKNKFHVEGLRYPRSPSVTR